MNISIKYFLLLIISISNYLTTNNKMTNTIIKETNSAGFDSMVLQYLVREPKIKSTKKKAIILLHGVGSNEKDLFALADQLPVDFYVIAARGQFTLSEGRYGWYNVDFSTGKPVFDKAQEISSREVIKKFMAQIKQKYQLDEVYLGGFSQGAIMSFSVGLTNPKEVKGIISLSGRLLTEIRPSIIKHDDLQRLKVFIAHGVQDNTLTVQYAREAKSYLGDLGVQLSYHEYNMGHQLNERVIHDMNAWLAE
jgi:phospholipase/carboxylesterase